MIEPSLVEYFEAAERYMDDSENDLQDHVGVAASATVDRSLFYVYNPMDSGRGLALVAAERLYSELEGFFGPRLGYSPKLADVSFAEFTRRVPNTGDVVTQDRVNFWPILRESGQPELWLAVREAPWQGYGSFARVDIHRPKSGAHVAILR